MCTKAGLLLVVAATFGAEVAVAQVGRPPDSASVSVRGSVRGHFQDDVRPLPFAVVQVVAPGLRRSAIADSAGEYRLERLPPGSVRLRVTHPGHEPLSVELLLPERGSVHLDLELQGRPVELSRIDVIREAGLADPEAREPGLEALAEVEMSSLDLAPGVGQPGLLDAVRSMPGNDPADATDILYMRGSTADLKLVLLDGAPVYTPFHVAGLLRSFEPGFLGSATQHVGGAPARYDGGLTHILDLRTRRPHRDGLRGSASVDLLSGSAALEGPLGRSAGFVASARALHGLGEEALGGRRPYGYRDFLLSAEAEPAPDQTLRGTVFWNEESVRLDFPAAPDDAWWSNRAASLGYSAHLGDFLFDATVAGSTYEASLPLQPTGTPDEPSPSALLASAATDRVRIVAEVTRHGRAGVLRTGVSFESLEAAYDARVLTETAPAAGSHASTSSVGAYVDVTRDLADGLSLRAGVRADLYGGVDARLAPRAALMWELGPDALLTVAAGRYHQAARTPDVEVERTLTEVVENGVPASELLPVAEADHVVLSLDQRVAGRVRVALEGFWKRYDGLFVHPGETVRSSGVDLRVHSAGARGTAWLGYGLSWFWSTRDLSGYASDFAGRHLLSAGLSGRLTGFIGAEARVAYGAGLPYTALPFRAEVFNPGAIPGDALSGGEPLVGGRATQTNPLVGGLDDEFLRLDLELHALFERRWSGRTWQIRPYLRVLNALNRRDALFFAFQPWRDDSLRPLAERPFLPVLGIAFKF